MVSDLSSDGVHPIRVVMADDHARIRGKVRRALEASGCVVCGEGASAADAVALAVQHRPDVALLDIHMPGSGIEAARQIHQALPDTVVVMLTQSGADEDLFDSLRAGASGYLLKDMDPTRLAHALRGVLDGEAAMPRQLVARILREFQGPPTSRFARRSSAAGKLSEREWEVMELLAEGLSTADVAQRLFLSPTTVRVHISAVLKKLRVKDRDSALTLLRKE